ncbi:MAG TPA: DUF885 domain-containing protein [Longimicrobiales bacterium]|nr:DUF885 domain-containing protein [Longimicrobiales bacterium]
MSTEHAPNPEVGTAADSIRALADRYVVSYFDAFPDSATLAGQVDAAHDRLPDISTAARERWHAEADELLSRLDDIDASRLPIGHPARVTAAFLRELLEASRDFRRCRSELWDVSPSFNGWPQHIAVLAGAQPVATTGEQDAALRRFTQLPRYIDQEIDNAREGIGLGYTSPRCNVEAMLRQLDSMLDSPIEDAPVVAMAEPGTAFHARLVELETARIRPAIARYRDFLREEYLPAAREDIGLSSLPDGERAYRAAVRYHSSVDMPPEEVHRLGLEQMALVRSEMRELARAEFGTDDVDSLLQRLRTDPAYLFTSRDELMRAACDAVDRATELSAAWFGRMPAAGVVVRPVPAFAEATAPAGHYRPPAEDGSRPGTYYINLHQAERQPRAGLESTAFHETVPGHHLQLALAVERRDLHPISRYLFLSGFCEGWALYAERLADEIGLFTGPIDRMGLLNNEAFRAARLVVDPGIHVMGWSRQQAIDYMLANTAEPAATVAAEVDRYIAVPGQATAYMIGRIEITRLRDLARSRLGPRFDPREFHDRLLEDGSVPLAFLREKIERWLEGVTPGVTEGDAERR